MSAGVNTTREGIEVKPGQVWRDLDKRMVNRTVRVHAIEDGYAMAFVLVNGQAGKPTRLAIRRMHKATTGWALVEGGAA